MRLRHRWTRSTTTSEMLPKAAGLLVALSVSLAGCSMGTGVRAWRPKARALSWRPRVTPTLTGERLPPRPEDTGGKGPNHGPWLPAMLNENKYVGQDAKDVRRELEAKGFTVRVEQGRFAHAGGVTWLEQSKADPQSVVLILTRCGPADERCPKRSRLSRDGRHDHIRCRFLPAPGVLTPTFYSPWIPPKGGAARCVTIPRKTNSDLVVFLRPRRQAVVVDPSEPKSSASYVNRFFIPVLHGLRTMPISLRGWHTLVIGGHRIDTSGWD